MAQRTELKLCRRFAIIFGVDLSLRYGAAWQGGPFALYLHFLSFHRIGNAGKLEQQLSLASQAAYEGSIPFARSKYSVHCFALNQITRNAQSAIP
jgi:hypothetical protein